MPVLLASRVSQEGERRIAGTLDDLASSATRLDLSGPVLLIIGEVAGLDAAGGSLDACRKWSTARSHMPSVVTANVLRTGAIVYLKDDGTWVGKLAEAAVAADADARAALEKLALAAMERGEVTSVYAFDVDIVDGRPEALSVREKIRAAGTPTV